MLPFKSDYQKNCDGLVPLNRLNVYEKTQVVPRSFGMS